LSISRVLGQIVGIAVLGAIWASRVSFHNGSIPVGGATEASVDIQIIALQETYLLMAMLITAALLLSIWVLFQTRRQ
jgi:hypothetical protein